MIVTIKKEKETTDLIKLFQNDGKIIPKNERELNYNGALSRSESVNSLYKTYKDIKNLKDSRKTKMLYKTDFVNKFKTNEIVKLRYNVDVTTNFCLEYYTIAKVIKNGTDTIQFDVFNSIQDLFRAV